MKNKSIFLGLLLVALTSCTPMPVYEPFVEPESDDEQVQEYLVTFICSNCRVFIYENDQDFSFAPKETNTTYTKDDVNFKVVAEEGYMVDDLKECFLILGTYDKLIQNPLKDEGVEKDDNTLFRITNIQTNLEIRITAK